MIAQLKLIQLLVLFFVLNMHPVHVSITNMEYFNNEKLLQFSTKIFKDDFQLLFVHLNEINIDFENQDSLAKYQDMINNYVFKNFKIDINEKPCQYSLKEVKKNDEVFWLSYNLKIKDEIRSIKIRNTLLLDLYFDQKNLLILKIGNKEEAYQFNIKDQEFKFDVNS